MVFTFFVCVVFIVNEVKNYRGQKEVNTSGGITNGDTVEVMAREKPTEKSTEKSNIEPAEEDIVLTFAGDVLLSDSLINLYNSASPEISGIISEDLLADLREADVTMVNEEFPFSTRGSQMADKQYTFKTNPVYVKVLKDMGVDIVTLANNHTLDFGIDALLDTIKTLDKANILHVGAGKNLEKAKTTEYITAKGKTLAFLGASRVIPIHSWNAGTDNPGLFTTYDPALLLEEIKLAKANSDFIVVYVHWGVEKKEYPEEYQRTMGKQYIDAGADMVIGSHPHVLQGIEFYKERPIVYSLGNFAFGSSSYDTMVLKVRLDKDNKMEVSIVPCNARNGYTTKLADDKIIGQFYKHMEQISYQAKISPQGIVLQN